MDGARGKGGVGCKYADEAAKGSHRRLKRRELEVGMSANIGRRMTTPCHVYAQRTIRGGTGGRRKGQGGRNGLHGMDLL